MFNKNTVQNLANVLAMEGKNYTKDNAGTWTASEWEDDVKQKHTTNKTLLSADLSGSFLGSVRLKGYDKLYSIVGTNMTSLASVDLEDNAELTSIDFSNAGRFFQSFYVDGAGERSWVKGTLVADRSFDTLNPVTIKLDADTYIQNFAVVDTKVVDTLQPAIDALGENLKNAYIVGTGAETLSFEKNTGLLGLYASDNELTGGIILPEKGSTLQYLVAENSALTGIKNLGAQTKLEALDVSGNYISKLEDLSGTAIHDLTKDGASQVDTRNLETTEWGRSSAMAPVGQGNGSVTLPGYKADGAKGVLAPGAVDRLDISGNILNGYPQYKETSSAGAAALPANAQDAQRRLPFEFAVVQTDLIDGNETGLRVDIKDDDIAKEVASDKILGVDGKYSADRYTKSVQTTLIRAVKNNIEGTVASGLSGALSFNGAGSTTGTLVQLGEAKAKAVGGTIDREFAMKLSGANVGSYDEAGAAKDTEVSAKVRVRRAGTAIDFHSTIDQYAVKKDDAKDTELSTSVFAQTGTPLYFKAKTNYYVNGVADDGQEMFEDFDIEVSGVEAEVQEEKDLKVAGKAVKYGFYKITPKTTGQMTVKATGKVSGQTVTYSSVFQVSRAAFTASTKNAYNVNPDLKDVLDQNIFDKTNKISVMAQGETAKVIDPNNADATVTFKDYNTNVVNPTDTEKFSSEMISFNNVDGTIYAQKPGLAVVHCVSSLGGSYDMWVYIHPSNMTMGLLPTDGKNSITIDSNSFDTATTKPAQLVVSANVKDPKTTQNLISNSSAEIARGKDKRTIKFVSSDENIVQVDQNGLLTYKNPGTATVTAYTVAGAWDANTSDWVQKYYTKTNSMENAVATKDTSNAGADTAAYYSPASYEFTVVCGEASTPKITGTAPTETIFVGATGTVSGTASGFSKNDAVKLNYVSLNPEIATVDATNGTVTAVAPGEATIEITGTESGQKATTQVKVKVGKDISKVTVNGLEASYQYEGKAIEPAVSLVDGTYALQKDKDYTLAFVNNSGIGEGTVTFTGMGDYAGTLSKTFTINGQSIAGGKVTLSKTKLTYTGKAQKVTVTVKDAAGATVDANAYTVSNDSMTKPGKQTVTVTDAAGNKLTATLKMVPKAVTNLKVANVKGAKAKITFKKAVGATKYQVKYTVAGSKAVTKNITGVSLTIKVAKGKKVTVQVKANSKGGYSKVAKKTFTTDKK